MNEQAQQVLADMLERALSGVDAAVEFSQAQIPDVVEQLLMWHMVESLLSCLAAACAALCSFALFRKGAASQKIAREAYKNGEQWTRFSNSSSGLTSHAYDFKASGVAFYVPASLMALVSPFFISTTWLKILIAPKLYLLEYAASLVK